MQLSQLKAHILKRSYGRRYPRPYGREDMDGGFKDFKVQSMRGGGATYLSNKQNIMSDLSIVNWGVKSRVASYSYVGSKDGVEHRGFIVIGEDDDVKALHCTCEDFIFRCRYSMGARGLSFQEADRANSEQDKMQLDPELFRLNTKVKYLANYPKDTNPGMRVAVCHHIRQAIMRGGV